MTLDHCERVAPGRWELGGVITRVPEDGVVRDTIWIETGSDVINGFTFAVNAVGTGAFAGQIDLDPRWAREFDRSDESDECVLAYGNSRTPVRLSTVPFEYEAEEGTLQALGIGATVTDGDTLRYALAQHAWFEVALPFSEFWIPDLDRVSRGISQPSPPDSDEPAEVQHLAGNCLRAGYSFDDVWVSQEAGCSPPTAPGAPLTANPDFFWVEGDVEAGIDPSAVLQTSEIRVVVTGQPQDVEILVGELQSVPNLLIDTERRDTSLTVAELAAAQLSDGATNLSDLTKLREIEHELGTISVWTATDIGACDNCHPLLMAALLEFEAEGRLVVEGIGGGWDGCYSLSSSWGRGQGAEVLLVLADPTWTVDMYAPEPYGPPELIDGVWYAVFPAAESTVGVNVLGIFDAEGSPVDCFG